MKWNAGIYGIYRVVVVSDGVDRAGIGSMHPMHAHWLMCGIAHAHGTPRQARHSLITTYRNCLDQHGVLQDFLVKAQAHATWRDIIAHGAH